ncbi:methanethiol S-methyltransferase [Dyella psychrodurans]|uniref:methanethiol S-methyltransferase n=1 Tax=Dyella psychrodurans TaxID=1927960 RepID=A0A370WWF1_9GAMM|nr:methanethiol S-methyltransferase [Dyella psychrodurans]RDS80381.1 isoprenylcysteine carboxylmethyltransferase family protein [Dyella psychrodurans]
MARVLGFVYGVLCYLAFFLTFLYLIGFVGNLAVPKSIDAGSPASLTAAISTNLALVALFGIQHSVMARPGFKSWWTRWVPQTIERSSYVLLASLVLILLFALWVPIKSEVWRVQSSFASTVLWVLFALGWTLVLGSTILINHFDLFGLRQVYLNLKNKAYTPIGFRIPLFYRVVRHPLVLGFLIAFWATPMMTAGHLLFAATMTTYVLIALQFEERDLVAAFGERYRQYQQRVSMLIPWLTHHKGYGNKPSTPKLHPH